MRFVSSPSSHPNPVLTSRHCAILSQDLSAHYLACDVVSKVYLNKILPDTAYGDPGKLKRRNSLNQRFRVPEGLNTEFVLTLDDDIVIPCADMELGLSVVEGHVNMENGCCSILKE